MQMADVMVEEGWKEAGYEYLCIDDCWSSQQRDAQGRLQADPGKFPGGIKKLADYVHSKGLKLGIYGGVGRKTCAAFPGSLGHYETDAQTFADWGVDLVQFDGCYVDSKYLKGVYDYMIKVLKKIGVRTMLSCERPLDERLFRQLVIGNTGLSYDQQESQMALWAIMAAPLLMSTNQIHISPRSKKLLQNKHVIAINQDPLGKLGSHTAQVNNFDVWERPLSDNQQAIAVWNKLENGGPREFSIREAPGWEICTPQCKVTVILPQYKEMGVYTPKSSLVVSVNPSGTALLKVNPIKGV